MSPTKKKKAGTVTHGQTHKHAHAPAPEEEEEGEALSVEDRLEIVEGDLEALKAKLAAHGIVF